MAGKSFPTVYPLYPPPCPDGSSSQASSRRQAYEALSSKLSTLPLTLRQPTLVPVAPRLYLPGELVRTNEFLVLLGRSGENVYFAERTAHQAQSIVNRRLAAIGNKFDGSLNDEHLANENADQPAQPLPHKSSTLQTRNSVSFREPIVEGKSQSPKYQRTGTEAGLVSSSASEVREKGGRKPIKSIIKVPTSPAVKNTSNNATSEEAGSEKNPTDASAAMNTALRDALQNAQQQAKEDGVVHITEFYDDGDDTPTRVELPPGYVPDASLRFEDGSEDFLDITGGRRRFEGKVQGGKEASDEDDEDLFSFLDMKKAEEEEAERKEIEEKKLRLQEKARAKREEKNFGQGLAKGFFGAPKVKSKLEAKPVQPKPLADDVKADSVPKAFNPPAVQERVVERKASRRKSRKTRKPHAVTLSNLNILNEAEEESKVYNEAQIGEFVADDSDGMEDRNVSKFRQLQSLGREVMNH